MRLPLAFVLAALCACSSEATSESFMVGIGGEYWGRALCEDTEHPALIRCEVRRTNNTREPVIRGLYRRGRADSNPSAALTIGLPSYTPELRFMPSPEAATTEAAATLCTILSDFGNADVECRVSSAATAVSGSIYVELQGESCPLIANVSDGGQVSVILQGCAAWDAVHQGLLEDFDALEAWYIGQAPAPA